MANYNNSPYNDTADECFAHEPSFHDHISVKSLLGLLYGLVFMTAVCGNTLVIYVVATNKNMQSVTNLFITNLALSDIMVNFTSLWLTPVYSYLGQWVWGSVMCHLVPLFQGMATFISALTLMAIAIDRYIAIIYPFRTRTSLMICVIVVSSIWIVALILVMPLAVQMTLYYEEECQVYICGEGWENPQLRVVYGFVVLFLQFGVPFIVIAFCYISIWVHLTMRRSMVTMSGRSNSDDRRRARLLKMLVAMVVIYLLAWFPVNSLNVLRDAINFDDQEYFVILFLFAHLCSMSATCWNPIVYAWMNDNFRREFKAVLPCFENYERYNGRSQSMTLGGKKSIQSAIITVNGEIGISTTPQLTKHYQSDQFTLQHKMYPIDQCTENTKLISKHEINGEHCRRRQNCHSTLTIDGMKGRSKSTPQFPEWLMAAEQGPNGPFVRSSPNSPSRMAIVKMGNGHWYGEGQIRVKEDFGEIGIVQTTL